MSLEGLHRRPFEQLSVDEKYAIWCNVVVLAEALVSLCIHIAVRFVAEGLGVPCVKNLESIVSFRNLLIHRYWIIDDGRVYGSMKANFKCVEEFIGRVKCVFQF